MANAVQRVQGLIRTLKDALERRLNTRIRSRRPDIPVARSAGLITTFHVKRPNRHMTSKNTSKGGPKVDAKFHDGIWVGLRMKSDE